MDFPIIRRAKKTDIDPHAPNGWANHLTNGKFASRRPHTPERDLPYGANWVVQKFGGTSIGKFGVKIAEDIVL